MPLVAYGLSKLTVKDLRYHKKGLGSIGNGMANNGVLRYALVRQSRDETLCVVRSTLGLRDVLDFFFVADFR
jgi:hypothetical protein